MIITTSSISCHKSHYARSSDVRSYAYTSNFVPQRCDLVWHRNFEASSNPVVYVEIASQVTRRAVVDVCSRCSEFDPSLTFHALLVISPTCHTDHLEL